MRPRIVSPGRLGSGLSVCTPVPLVPALTGTSGVWQLVTPADLTVDPDGVPAAGAGQNFGTQGVDSDLTRPGVVYAAGCYQGLWKSTDYGLNYTKVVPVGNDPMKYGRPNFRVAPNGTYIIATALYPFNGYSNGAWRSFDGGVTWARSNVGAPNGDDIGSFEILSSDSNRIAAVSHSNANLYESRDAGATWTDQGAVGTTGSPDISWIDADTLLAIGEGDGDPGGPGTWRGVRSGSSWPWTWTWTKVYTEQHWHGTCQIFRDATYGAVYMSGPFGVDRSTDNGATWTTVSATAGGGVIASGTKLYSSANYASPNGFSPRVQVASRSAGTVWTDVTVPGGLNNGSYHGCTVTDGLRTALVMSCWSAGIWRYVE